MRFILGILVALILATPAMAQNSTVAAMTAASALSGPELFYCIQGGADRKCTPTQILTYTASATKTLTNTTFDTAGTGNAFSINGVAATANTGTGAIARAVSPAFTTPNLGTPSAGVATNLTGTAAGLTAGNVTTNANLTGEVTSVGNAATVTNSAVIAKVLTGYTSGAGTVASTDTVLQAIQKLNGNAANIVPASVTNAAPTITAAGAACSGFAASASVTTQQNVNKGVLINGFVTISNAGTCAGNGIKVALPFTPNIAGAISAQNLTDGTWTVAYVNGGDANVYIWGSGYSNAFIVGKTFYFGGVAFAQ